MTQQPNGDDPNGKAVIVTLSDEAGNPVTLEEVVTKAQSGEGMLTVNLSIAIPVAIGIVLLCLACGFWFWWR